MAVAKRVKEFSHREFYVVVAQESERFRGVARDGKRRVVEEIAGGTLDEVTAEIKRRLNHLSQDFVSVQGAINLFGKAFPGGFTSEFYGYYERKYKDNTAQFVADKLAERRIKELIAGGDHAAVAAAAKQALSTSNLSFANEQMALGDALKNGRVVQPFAEGLHELLYGDFDIALEELASLLKPYNAVKWPILTFWPFFRFPDRHMFLKPTIVQTCADRMGYELRYDSMPNRDTYRSLLGFTTFLREGIAELAPRDNIDIQTFMYVVGKDGYVRHAVQDREAREGPSPS